MTIAGTKVRSRSRRLVGVGLAGATAAAALAQAQPASGAYSGEQYASSNQCQASYNSNFGTYFRIRDNDLNDSDYCYVNYNFVGPNDAYLMRWNAQQDAPGYQIFPTDTGSNKTVWWHVCKERQNDPDVCSGPYQTATH